MVAKKKTESILLTCKPLWKTEWPIKLASILMRAAPCGKRYRKEKNVNKCESGSATCQSRRAHSLHSVLFGKYARRKTWNSMSLTGWKNPCCVHLNVFWIKTYYFKAKIPQTQYPKKQSVIRSNKYFCELGTWQT